jgi:WD40 repeat protein
MMRRHLVPLAILGVALAATADAHHRQTPPVVQFTSTGDTPLPRVPAPGTKTMALAISAGPMRKIVSVSPWKNKKDPNVQTVIAPLGQHDDPAISLTGRSIAFDTASDPLALGLPGRQVVGAFVTDLFPVSSDPSGTSVNPSIDTTGHRIVFESTGDLAGTGNAGARQVFLRDVNGSVQQLSAGVGTSRNPVISPKQRFAAFESTSDPKTGIDTGVAQVWLGTVDGLTPFGPLTAGPGPSRNPVFSNDGRVLAFESTADLTVDLPFDTGTSQIYIYDTKTKTFARITDESVGCTLPSAYTFHGDWRVAYVCNGDPRFYMLRGDQQYRVQTEPGSTTQRVIAELGAHFLVMSTTSNLLDQVVTAGNQIYLVNLFKRPAQPIPGAAVWFPARGIPPR